VCASRLTAYIDVCDLYSRGSPRAGQDVYNRANFPIAGGLGYGVVVADFDRDGILE
jgi:hypothetical protein